MHARLQRLQRALPDVSGQKLSGVMAVLAVLGFGSVALSSLSGGMVQRGETFPDGAAASRTAASRRHVTPTRAGAAPPAPAPVPATAPSDDAHADTNRAPEIADVQFRPAVATAGQDLRLQVEASDPEGDPLVLRTEWIVDGHRFETDTPVLPHTRFARGSRVRARVRAADGRHESSPFATDEIAVSNAAPLFTSFPGGFDGAGTFVYPLAAVDPDGDDDLHFRLLEGPRGMRIGPRDAVLRWEPAPGQSGLQPVRLEVRDGHGGRSLQSFDLYVHAHSGPASRLADLAPQD